MSEVLLINRDDIMRLTGLDGSIDIDKVLPHVNTAQDIHLQPITGSKLLDKCKALIAAGTLGDAGNEYYKALVYTYITPALVFLTMWDAMPFIQYTIANGGIFQHNSENSNSPIDDSVNQLTQRFKDKAGYYTQVLSAYICDNSTEFPEVSEGIDGGEVRANGVNSNKTNYTSWSI
jgi:hypothetical protein